MGRRRRKPVGSAWLFVTKHVMEAARSGRRCVIEEHSRPYPYVVRFEDGARLVAVDVELEPLDGEQEVAAEETATWSELDPYDDRL